MHYAIKLLRFLLIFSTDPNECLDDPVICDQQCTDINTGYECSCVDGYRLDDDLHNCTGIYYTLL